MTMILITNYSFTLHYLVRGSGILLRCAIVARLWLGIYNLRLSRLLLIMHRCLLLLISHSDFVPTVGLYQLFNYL